MKYWFLLSSIRYELEQGIRNGKYSAQDKIDFEARGYDRDSGPGDRLLSIAGESAQIRIEGVLTKKPDYFAYIFGGGNTTYSEIIAAIATAEADSSVKEIIFSIDSPGGAVSGMFDAMTAIKNASKPTKTIFEYTGASAAYALGSQSDTVEAKSKATRVGSVGIVVDAFVYENEVSVTSSNAPNKRPDFMTDEGKAIVRAELDDYENLMIEGIAEGRDTTTDKVKSDFGKGGMVIAENALKAGMIDSIQSDDVNKTTASNGGQKEGASMDLNQLKAEHPAVYQAAVAEGAAKERDNVTAHLILGKQSGAMDVAIDAIEKGEGMTATITAKYMAAGMNKNDLGARGADETLTEEILGGANTETTEGATTEQSDLEAFSNGMGAA